MKRLFYEPLRNFLESFLNFLPNIISFLFILIVGVIFAFVMKIVLKKLFSVMKLENFAERHGINQILSKSGMRDGFSSILAKFFAWVVFLIFFIISLDALKVQVIHSLLERFFLYIPNIFVAFIIIFFGFLLSSFLSRAVLIALVNEGFKTAGIISKFIKIMIIFISFSMALEQLGIGKETVLVAFAILFGGFIFGLSLAFGLGGKEFAKKYLEDYFKEEERDNFKHL